jgi:hypothetical protein
MRINYGRNVFMNLKKMGLLVVVFAFVAVAAFAQSVKPRAGEYVYESSTARHWVSIEDEGGDRYTIQIVSTNRELSDGVKITGAYWRSGAIEFALNGRTVHIQAESGGRAISCTLFGSVVLRRE